MKKINLILICIALSIRPVHGAEPKLSVSKEASLRIQSVRINRSTSEVAKNFGTRLYLDGSPGVSIQFLMKLKDTAILPLARDAVTIDTFMDDTYQNLMGGNSYASSYSSQPSAVSTDGSSLVFSVGASRPPADEAGRVFVRGKIQARIARGNPQVESALLPLVVGQGSKVGPFLVALRAISDVDNRAMSLTLSMRGDTSRILGVRVLDKTGTSVLSDPKQTQLPQNQGDNSVAIPQPISIHLALSGYVSNSVKIELSFAEKTERVSIPFEAQVDVGVAKAGPIEFSEDKMKATGASSRPWPPPKSEPENMPPRRALFVPVANTNAAATNK